VPQLGLVVLIANLKMSALTTLPLTVIGAAEAALE